MRVQNTFKHLHKEHTKQHNAAIEPARCSYPLYDCHLHFTDFLAEHRGADALFQHMDDSNIKKAVLFGLPVVKKWDACDAEAPHYYLDDNAKCYYYSMVDQIILDAFGGDTHGDRIAPMICGFNPTDKCAIKHVERMYAKAPDFWRGIGEVLFRHDDLTNLTEGETARPNHPAMDAIYRFAAEKNLPVLLHQNISEVGVHDHPEYLHELEDALIAHPETTFVWGHAGCSRRVVCPMWHDLIDQMLRTYPNLHVDFSWILLDMYVCPGGKANPDWVALAERHADRILMGSDVVGDTRMLGTANKKSESFLAKLSDATRNQVCRTNGERIYFARSENIESNTQLTESGTTDTAATNISKTAVQA